LTGEAVEMFVSFEDNNRAILSSPQVVEIRESAEPGVELAIRYGVSTSTISAIRHRRLWKHLSGELAA
jgi:hypothetical protein